MSLLLGNGGVFFWVRSKAVNNNQKPPTARGPPSGAHNSGYGKWHPRSTQATQCLGV
jgi:hypothetical protein